jgi:hypothetical protein
MEPGKRSLSVVCQRTFRWCSHSERTITGVEGEVDEAVRVVDVHTELFNLHMVFYAALVWKAHCLMDCKWQRAVAGALMSLEVG